jgi:flagellar biosynthesis GTPase FlhF
MSFAVTDDLASQVRATEPEAKHLLTVHDILRDKASGWSFNYFKECSSSVDVPLTRAIAGVDFILLEAEAVTLRKSLSAVENSHAEDIDQEKKAAVEDMRRRLDAVKREMEYAQDKATQDAKRKEAEELRQSIAVARKEMEDARTREIRRLTGLLEKNRQEVARLRTIAGNVPAGYESYSAAVVGFSKQQYKENHRRRHMQHLRNKFMEDGDQDYLTRGVTWVENHVARL